MWKLRSILCMLAHCHGYIVPGVINSAKKGSLPSWGTHNNVMRTHTHTYTHTHIHTHTLTELDCVSSKQYLSISTPRLTHVYSTGPLVERRSTKISSTKDFTCSQGPVIRKITINNWIQRGRERERERGRERMSK